jgi:hypothetical protein
MKVDATRHVASTVSKRRSVTSMETGILERQYVYVAGSKLLSSVGAFVVSSVFILSLRSNDSVRCQYSNGVHPDFLFMFN